MFMHRRAALISLVFVAATLPWAAAAQAPSLAGTWKLNAEKSIYDPAELGDKSARSMVSRNVTQDAWSFKQLNANAYHVENELKGKVLTINHIVVAADGRTRTVTVTGTNAAGQKIHNVVVREAVGAEPPSRCRYQPNAR